MKPIRRSIAARVRGFLDDWSLPRQLRGADPEREAAKTRRSRELRPRLDCV